MPPASRCRSTGQDGATCPSFLGCQWPGPGGRGRVQRKIPTVVNVATCRATIQTSTSSHKLTATTANKLEVPSHLALRLTARCSFQSRMGGPKRGCSINQRCVRSDPRAKKKAATSRKGVVGRSGRTTPTTASPRQSHPNARYGSRVVQSSKSAHRLRKSGAEQRQAIPSPLDARPSRGRKDLHRRPRSVPRRTR